MSPRSTQRSASSQTSERRKSARLASNRILDEITIGTTTDTARSADDGSSSELEVLYESLTQSQKKARKEPARKPRTPVAARKSPVEPTPSTSTSTSDRPLTAGELVVRQQRQEQAQRRPERLSESPPVPSTSTGITHPKKTPAKKTPAKKKHPPNWVRDRIKQRNLRLEEILNVVDAEEGVQFIVKWKKLPQPERIEFSDLRQVYPKETLRFLISRMQVMPESQFDRNRTR